MRYFVTASVHASPMSLVDGFAFALLSDVLSVLQFLVVIFFAAFQVGVLAPEEWWKIFPSKRFQPLGESIVVMLTFVCHLHEKLLLIYRQLFMNKT